MKYIILAEVRENYPSLIKSDSVYNDYVSKKSMLDFCDSLNKIGYNCTFLGGIKELFHLYQSKTDISDIIFINYNYGLPAAYKRTQCPTLLELMKAQYSGSDPFTSLLVNDKEYSKRVLRSIGISSPDSILIFDIDNIGEKLVAQNIMPPFVVKPNCEGSSLGITDDNLCDNFKKVENVAKNLLKDFSEVIIEKYVPGYECTVWVIGNPDKFHLVAPLLISQNENFYFKRKIFTMQDKANKVRRYALPNGILSNEIIKQIKQISKSIFIELGLRDYARFDFRITDNKIFFIEANALPIFSKTSEIGQITKLYNISYENICSLLIQTINERLMTKTN